MEHKDVETVESRMEEGRAANSIESTNNVTIGTDPKPEAPRTLLKTSSFRHIAADGAAKITERLKRIDMSKTMADGMTRNNLGSISSSRFKVLFSFIEIHHNMIYIRNRVYIEVDKRSAN